MLVALLKYVADRSSLPKTKSPVTRPCFMFSVHFMRRHNVLNKMLGSYAKVLLLNEPYYMYTACARSSMHIHLHNHFTVIRSSVLDTTAVHLLQYCYRGQDLCQGVLAAFRPGSSHQTI